MIILAGNFLLYLLWFLISFSKAKRKLTVYNVSVLWITLIAFFGLFSFVNGDYTAIFWSNNVFYAKPYIYCFISMFVFTLPLAKYNKRIEIEQLDFLDNKKTLYLLKFLLFVSVILTLIYSIGLLRAISSGQSLMDLYSAYHEEGSDVLGYSKMESRLLWLLQPFHNVFYWFAIIVSLLYLSRQNNHRLLCWSLILFTIGMDVINLMIRAARGELVYLTIKIILVLILLWPYLNKRIKKQTISFSLIFFGLIALFTIAVSISRFDDSNSSQSSSSSIIRYLGEAYPNLSNNIWGKVLHYPMGLRMFPFITGSITDSNVVSLADQQEWWEYFTGIPMLNFKTLYGDFYIEFGEYGALLAILIMTLIFYPFLRSKKLTFWCLPVWGVYLDILVISPLFFSYRGTSRVYTFVYCILGSAFIYFFLYAKRKIKKNGK